MSFFDGVNSKFFKNKNNIRDRLIKSGIPAQEVDNAMRSLEAEIQNVGYPKIALIGFTGVGKSSTLNALFNAGQPTSDIRACTQKEAEIIGDVSKYTGSKGSVIIYDMPGLGEDKYKDQIHFQTYLRVLPIVDVAVWTFQTNDRIMTPMQKSLEKLIKYLGDDFTKKLMFSINKADAAAPGELEWNRKLNIPSPKQNENIKEQEMYVFEKIRQVIPSWNKPVISYSARTRYRLEPLMEAMIELMPPEKRWVLDSVADVADPLEFIDPRLLEYIMSQRRR